MHNRRPTLVGLLAIALGALLLCASAARAEGDDYRLGAEDLLKISVFDHPELSVDVRVSKSGNITFPLLGEVQVAGASSREVEQRLSKALESGAFVRQPQVAVLIADYQSHKVSVMGQVAKPGQYALTTSNKVLDLLALAGGPINAIAGDQATLIRQDGSKLPIDLRALFDGDPTQNPVVAGGDTIYVPRAPLFYVYGEVQRPGPYRLERDMTVTQAISAGGGLTQKGTEHGMKVKRRSSDGKEHEVKVRGPDLLQPDDVLSIKESWF
jgi:polysaccharide export outer membrane protein